MLMVRVSNYQCSSGETKQGKTRSSRLLYNVQIQDSRIKCLDNATDCPLTDKQPGFVCFDDGGCEVSGGVVLCTGSRCREWCLRKGYYRARWYYPGCSITSSLTVLLLVISKYSTVIFIQNFLQRTPFAFQINFVFVRFSLLLIFHIIVVG